MKIIEIREKLQGALPKAPPRVQTALVWLEQHIPEVAWNGIEGVSQEAEVSPATMVRAVQSAGFAGYVELQRQVRDLGPSPSLAWRLFREHESDGPGDIITSVVRQETSNLEQLGQILRPQLPALLTWLLQRRRIVVAASLMTAALADHLALHLRLLLGAVDYVDASSSEAWLRIRDLNAEDGVIGVSYPRYSEATAAFLARAHCRTPHIVFLTDLAGASPKNVTMTVRLPSASESHYSSTVALMSLIQILAHELASREPERIRQNIDQADVIWRELNGLGYPEPRLIPEEEEDYDSD